LDEISEPRACEPGEPSPACSFVIEQDKPVGFVPAAENIEGRQIPVEVAAKV
jgi:hypothetical protein